MQVRNNISAINTYRSMNNTTNKLQKTYEKLSSGYEINNAADNTAGLAISEKMRGQISGLHQAGENIRDGISLLHVADAGLGQISNPNLIRLRELAVQAANDTLTDADRQLIQTEVDEIKNGIDDIANNTEFNTIKLLNQTAPVAGVSDLGGQNYIANKYIVALDVMQDGRFDLKTNEGYPSTEMDNHQILIYGQGSTTTPSVLLNGNQIFLQGAISKPTEKVGETFVTTYQVGDIEIKQTVSLRAAKFNFQYDIKNTGTTTQNAGFQFHMDTMLGNDDNAPFNVKGVDLSLGKIYKGTELPTTFGVYNNSGNPDIKAEGVITGEGIITSPDEFRVGQYNQVSSHASFIENQTVGDSGYAVVWNEKPLAPGEKRTVNTLYGLGVPPTLTNEPVWEDTEIVDKNIILQVGPNEEHTYKIRLTDARTPTLGIHELNMTTREEAEQAIAIIDAAIAYVSSERSRFGAYSNALEHIQSNVGNYEEMLSKVESTVRDADMAAAVTKLQKDQVVMQSAQSMMAQINQMSQGILEILQ